MSHSVFSVGEAIWASVQPIIVQGQSFCVKMNSLLIDEFLGMVCQISICLLLLVCVSTSARQLDPRCRTRTTTRITLTPSLETTTLETPKEAGFICNADRMGILWPLSMMVSDSVYYWHCEEWEEPPILKWCPSLYVFNFQAQSCIPKRTGWWKLSALSFRGRNKYITLG